MYILPWISAHFILNLIESIQSGNISYINPLNRMSQKNTVPWQPSQYRYPCEPFWSRCRNSPSQFPPVHVGHQMWSQKTAKQFEYSLVYLLSQKNLKLHQRLWHFSDERNSDNPLLKELLSPDWPLTLSVVSLWTSNIWFSLWNKNNLAYQIKR